MKIDLYTATGTKSGSLELPATLFEAPINKGLMHLALVRQQSNRRHPIAHAKHRGEVVGSTKKLFQQKGTGRARRGPLRSPLMRGGGKSFGPRNEANFIKEMPKKMRRAALFSCLSLRAKEGAIVALENYPDDVKTKSFVSLLKKLPLTLGRRIVFVLAGHQRSLELSARNVPRVKTLLAQYLNPEDILAATNIVFLADAVKVAEETFTRPDGRLEKRVKNITKQEGEDAEELKNATEKKLKKSTAKKAAAKEETADSKPKKKKVVSSKKSAPSA